MSEDKKYVPQPEDYFTLDGIGFYNSAVVNPAPKPSASTVTYTTYVNGKEKTVGYTMLYWESVAFPNPAHTSQSSAIPYVGATSINGLSIILDSLNIVNDTSTSTIIDIISANPANYKKNGADIIPPYKLKRFALSANSEKTLDRLSVTIPFVTDASQTTVSPYYAFGNGVGVAFPSSLTTTGTTTKTTTISHSVENVSISALAHFEP